MTTPAPAPASKPTPQATSQQQTQAPQQTTSTGPSPLKTTSGPPTAASSGTGTMAQPIAITGLDFTTPDPSMALTVVSRADRSALDTAGREKLHANAILKLPTEFTAQEELMKQTNQGQGFLSENLDFLQQVKNLQDRLESYSMHDVFLMYEIDANTGIPVNTNSDNLLESYMTIDFDTVKANSEMYRKFGDTVTKENLLWSKQLIMNSCEANLRNKISNLTATLPQNQDTGPVIFHLLASLIVSTSANVARAITVKLSTMRLHHFAGEDVEQMAATVRGAAARLVACNKLPSDMHDIVYDILDSSTIYKFRNYFETLENTQNPDRNDWKKLLDHACSKYRALILAERWHPTKRRPSTFVAHSSPPNPDSGTDPSLPPGKVLRTHDRGGKPIDRTPPKPSEPSSRNHGGQTEHWCGACDWNFGRWGNHPEAEHEAFVNKQKERKERRKSKNAAAPDESTESDKSSESDTLEPTKETQFKVPTPKKATQAGVTSLSRVGTYAPF